MTRPLKIANASGFWGDQPDAAARLARLLEIDAPPIIVEMAEDSLASKLRRRKRARRQSSAGVKSR